MPPKFYKDKKTGRVYAKVGKKRIYKGPGMTNAELIKWIIKHYTKPKKSRKTRKSRKSRKGGDEPMSAPSTEVTPTPQTLSYINNQRIQRGEPPLAETGIPNVFVKETKEPTPSIPYEPPPMLEYEPAVKDEKVEKEGKLSDRPRRKAAKKGSKVKGEVKIGDETIAYEADEKLASAIKKGEAKLKKADEIEKDDKKRRAGEIKKTMYTLGSQFSLDELTRIANVMIQEGTVAGPAPTEKTPLIAWLVRNNYDVVARIAKRRQVGDGKEESKDALTNIEIDKIMEPYKPRYLGTIPRDGWSMLSPPLREGKSAWIMNTDPAGQKGQHWVAMLMDLDNKTIEYYDSFAEDIPDDILRPLKVFIDTHRPDSGYLKLKTNHIIDQDARTSNCGWFCCKFIIDRFRGKSWRECTKYDDHIRGEKDILKFKKTYDTYI